MISLRRLSSTFLILLTVALSGCATSDYAKWQKIRSRSSIEAFERFIDKHEASIYADSARARIVVLRQALREAQSAQDYSAIASSRSVDSLEGFVARYQDTAFADSARKKILLLKSSQGWSELRRSNDISRLRTFVEQYRIAPYADSAESLIGQLERVREWERARIDNSSPALERFIELYPDSPEAGEAAQMIQRRGPEDTLARLRKEMEMSQRRAAEEGYAIVQVIGLGVTDEQSHAVMKDADFRFKAIGYDTTWAAKDNVRLPFLKYLEPREAVFVLLNREKGKKDVLKEVAGVYLVLADFYGFDPTRARFRNIRYRTDGSLVDPTFYKTGHSDTYGERMYYSILFPPDSLAFLLSDPRQDLRTWAASKLDESQWSPSSIREQVLFLFAQGKESEVPALGSEAVPVLVDLLIGKNRVVQRSAANTLVSTSRSLPVFLSDTLLGSRFNGEIESAIRAVPAVADLFLTGPSASAGSHMLHVVSVAPPSLRQRAARELVRRSQDDTTRLNTDYVFRESSRKAFLAAFRDVPEFASLFDPGTAEILTVLEEGDKSAAWEDLSASFPNNPGLMVLKEQIEDASGRRASEFVQEGKLMLLVAGNEITKVSVTVKNIADHPIRVLIEAGSYFAAPSNKVQNMVATESKFVDLAVQEQETISINAACVNKNRRIPGTRDNLTYFGLIDHPKLLSLAAEIDTREVISDVAQAAVWIITDNADFSELGILQRRSSRAFSPSRVIDVKDTVLALMLLDSIGVDVKTRRIWNDYDQLFAEVGVGDLQTWLSETARRQ